MSSTNLQVDTSELLASTSTWLTILAGALARGEDAEARHAQATLRELGWVVLGPADIAAIEAEGLVGTPELTADEPAEPAEDVPVEPQQ